MGWQWSIHLTPGFAMDDLMNRLGMNAEPSRHRPLCRLAALDLLADIPNRFVCQLGGMMVAASRTRRVWRGFGRAFFLDHVPFPALHLHISHIVERCPGKQVVRSYTRWVIAMVTDEWLVRWDWAVRLLKCERMGAYGLPAPNVEVSISGNVPSPSPYPTLTGLVDLVPKSIDNGTDTSTVSARRRAIGRAFGFDLDRFTTTERADTNDGCSRHGDIPLGRSVSDAAGRGSEGPLVGSLIGRPQAPEDHTTFYHKDA